MGHWFDELSRPHTRRATLKAAAVAAGALFAGEALRPVSAWATEREPCFGPCVNAAGTAWNASRESCTTGGLLTAAQGGVSAVTGVNLPLGVLLVLAGNAYATGCLASAELTWHRSTLACRGSECGNPDKYPDGKVPPPPKKPPVCDPSYEKVCGDRCCRTFVDCCFSKSQQQYVCYAAGHNCEGA